MSTHRLVLLAAGLLTAPLALAQPPASLEHLQQPGGTSPPPPQLPSAPMAPALHAVVDWTKLDELGDRVTVAYTAQILGPNLSQRLGSLDFVLIKETGRGVLHRFETAPGELLRLTDATQDGLEVLTLRAAFEIDRRSWERWHRGHVAALALDHGPQGALDPFPFVRRTGLATQGIQP